MEKIYKKYLAFKDMSVLYFDSKIEYYNLYGTLISSKNMSIKNVFHKTNYRVMECWLFRNGKFKIMELSGFQNNNHKNYLYLNRFIVEENLTLLQLKSKYKYFYDVIKKRGLNI